MNDNYSISRQFIFIDLMLNCASFRRRPPCCCRKNADGNSDFRFVAVHFNTNYASDQAEWCRGI